MFTSHGKPETLEKFLDWGGDCFEFVQIQLNYLDWTMQNAKRQYEIITEHHLPVWMNLYNELSLTKDKKRWEEAMKVENGPVTCVGCGQCTSHCPQNIDVPGYMKKLTAGKF